MNPEKRVHPYLVDYKFFQSKIVCSWKKDVCMVCKKVYRKRYKVNQYKNVQYGVYYEVLVFEARIKLCKFQKGKKQYVYKQVKTGVCNFYDKEVIGV